MKEKLSQIARKARQDKKLKFTALVHHINEGNLRACYQELKLNKACGIDGQTVEAYGEELGNNLKKLVDSLKDKTYRPKPVKRVYIPKPGKAEQRPLGIPSVEDKIVQIAVKKLLESIYEADFLDISYGYRPGLSCHDAIKALNNTVYQERINHIVEVDIKGFFNNVDHSWLIRCLKERIADPNLLWLVEQFLKAGYVEAGKEVATKMGTPQGGNLSPLLANIYLHYVLDLWFVIKIQSQGTGPMKLIRYCDDFLVCCEKERDATQFLTLLKARLGKFGLEISESKSKIVKFGRGAWYRSETHKEKMETFNFLGFTHYCGKSRLGYFMMYHKTNKENLSRKLKEINAWLKEIRSQKHLKDWWLTLKSKIKGHYNYYGISGNDRSLGHFYYRIFFIVHKWINRRSQKKSMTMEEYCQYLKYNPLPKPKISYKLY
jgi:RNA-directed DNA polymerase